MEVKSIENCWNFEGKCDEIDTFFLHSVHYMQITLPTCLQQKVWNVNEMSQRDLRHAFVILSFWFHFEMHRSSFIKNIRQGWPGESEVSMKLNRWIRSKFKDLHWIYYWKLFCIWETHLESHLSFFFKSI